MALTVFLFLTGIPTASGQFPAQIDISSLNGTNGFVINCGWNIYGEACFSPVGDVNGDGTDDLVMWTGSDCEPYCMGEAYVYVVFSRPKGSWFPAVLDPTKLDGSNGFVFNTGVIHGARMGLNTEDINGDGIVDLVIAHTYVVFGRPKGSRFPPCWTPPI